MKRTFLLIAGLFFLTPHASAEADVSAVAWRPDQPLIIRSVLPIDCRLVRGFTHGPVDGREDTRYSNGVVGEWAGLTGIPAVNYRVFNGNNGLHLTLPDGGFDVLQVRGDWRGKVYLNSDSLMDPKVKPLCEIPLRKTLAHHGDAERLSFFYSEGQTGTLKHVSLFRVESGSLRGGSQEVATRGKCVTPVQVSAPWKDWTKGVTAITLKMRVENAETGAVVTVRVGDVLDARRKAMIVDLRVPAPGDYSVTLDIPDQIYLPPKAKWKPLPRLDGAVAPKPSIDVSIESADGVAFESVALLAHSVPRAQALPEAVAWRKFLLRGLFAALSEPRPWMHLKDGAPVREQIANHPTIKRYEIAITELLETAEIARLLAPDDPLIVQYHNWIYQNIDRRKPHPAPVLSKEADAPRWAVCVRDNWGEQAHIARWWLDHRMTSNGELGGGPQDDTDMFQVWQCLPMIESEPLGADLRAASHKLTDILLDRYLEEGINQRSMDALHAYEEGVNQLALNAWWNYGDPVHFERVMQAARSASRLMVETKDGRLHFVSDRKVGIEEARNGYPTIGNTPGTWNWAPARLMFHPMYVVADYNRNPAVLERFAQWGETWLGYQAPNAFVDKVEIATGKPVRTSNLPASANISPVDEFLALYQLTGDAKWRRPYQMGVDGGGFSGAPAQYGRSIHALLRWPEPYQSYHRKQYSEAGSGYAGFFVNQDRALLDKWLSDSLSWFQRYRHMNTAAEQKTDRVLTYNATTALSCYLGDAPNRNRWLNLGAVSYEGLQGKDFAALVWDAGPKKLKVAVYNFADRERTGRMRVWRLQHGRYRIRTGPDRDDDGSMNEAIMEQQTELQRYSAIPLRLPPRQVTVVEIEQLERLDDIRDRADLAVSPLDTRLAGETLIASIHNIGNQPAANVRVVLKRDGKVVAEQAIARIDAPRDAKPRVVQLRFAAVKSGDVLQVDPNNDVPEIAEHNNSLVCVKPDSESGRE
ncbi:MAG TPA: hypothetical protein DCY79_01365 [Planctomycetaceae bacterium]|nr:hypothetical protein [Planctomycetaceae bacterium]